MMSRRCCVLFAWLLFSVSAVGRAEEPADRLYEYIADYVVNANKVLTQRHVCIGKGVITRGSTEKISANAVWYIRAVENEQDRLDAFANTTASSLGYKRELWVQQLRTKKDYRRRDSPLHGRTERVYTELKDLREKERESLPILDPFAQAVCSSSCLVSGGSPPLSIRDLLSDQLKLGSCTQVGGGDLKVEFLIDTPVREAKVACKFSKDSGYMVTEYIVSAKRKGKDDDFIVKEHNFTTWQKLGDLYVPKSLEASKPALSTKFHVLVDFSWKLGKDVPKNIVTPRYKTGENRFANCSMLIGSARDKSQRCSNHRRLKDEILYLCLAHHGAWKIQSKPLISVADFHSPFSGGF